LAEVSFKNNTVPQLDNLLREATENIVSKAENDMAILTKRETELLAVAAHQRTHSQSNELKTIYTGKETRLAARDVALTEKREYFQALKLKKTEFERSKKRKARKKGSDDDDEQVDLTASIDKVVEGADAGNAEQKAAKQKAVAALGKKAPMPPKKADAPMPQGGPLMSAEDGENMLNGLLDFDGVDDLGLEDDARPDLPLEGDLGGLGDNEEDVLLKVALYLSLEAGSEINLADQCFTFSAQDGSDVNAFCFKEELAGPALIARGRKPGTAVGDGNCLPHSLSQHARKWEEHDDGSEINLFTKAAVRASVTAFVRDPLTKLPLTEETHALAHLAGQVERAAWATKFKADEEYLYPCFLIAFGCLAKRNVGIWVNSSADLNNPKPLLVKFDFAAALDSGRDEVAFVNHNHWIPVFKQ
jgi:hypothetical protein